MALACKRQLEHSLLHYCVNYDIILYSLETRPLVKKWKMLFIIIIMIWIMQNEELALVKILRIQDWKLYSKLDWSIV